MDDNKEASNPKIKYGFRIHQDVSDMIDSHLPVANTQSRSSFIEEAVRFYCCELDSKTHQNVITTEMARVVRDNIKNLENHIAYVMFNVAGEMANMNLLLADRLLNLPDEDIRATRNDAYDIVRRRKGFVSFADAIDNARYDPESDE